MVTVVEAQDSDPRNLFGRREYQIYLDLEPRKVVEEDRKVERQTFQYFVASTQVLLASSSDYPSDFP